MTVTKDEALKPIQEQIKRAEEYIDSNIKERFNGNTLVIGTDDLAKAMGVNSIPNPVLDDIVSMYKEAGWYVKLQRIRSTAGRKTDLVFTAR